MKKLASLDVMIDARDVHSYHASRADVQMSYFGVPHHTRRQAHASAMRFEQSVRVIFDELVVIRRRRERNRVSLARGRVTPTIDDNQSKWTALLSQVHSSLLTAFQ